MLICIPDSCFSLVPCFMMFVLSKFKESCEPLVYDFTSGSAVIVLVTSANAVGQCPITSMLPQGSDVLHICIRTCIFTCYSYKKGNTSSFVIHILSASFIRDLRDE